MHQMHIGAVVEREGHTPHVKATPRTHSGWFWMAKRCIDILGATFALILFAPLMVLVAIAIYLDSPGPILFRQTRVGKNGREFKFLKFRSMRPDAEAMLSSVMHLNEAKGPIFKIENDPRITRVGRIIRKFSLDELPQLFNVLKGDMGLVGPRPHLPREVKHYEAWHAKRLEVLPGVVCLREVSGRSKLSFDEWVRLDLEYLERQSLWLDIKILLRVLPAMLFHRGAC